MTHNEHANKVRECLANVEATNRAHHKAIRKLHKALAAYAAEHGAEAGIGEDNIVLAAAPKNPPDND
jgi:hypothetical protein